MILVILQKKMFKLCSDLISIKLQISWFKFFADKQAIQIYQPIPNDDNYVIASALRERSPREPGEPGLMPV